MTRQEEGSLDGPSDEGLLVARDLPEGLEHVLVLLLGKVKLGLVVRDGVRVGHDDLAGVGAPTEEGSDDARLGRGRTAGVVVKDGEEREWLERERGRDATGRARERASRWRGQLASGRERRVEETDVVPETGSET